MNQWTNLITSYEKRTGLAELERAVKVFKLDFIKAFIAVSQTNWQSKKRKFMVSEVPFNAQVPTGINKDDEARTLSVMPTRRKSTRYILQYEKSPLSINNSNNNKKIIANKKPFSFLYLFFFSTTVKWPSTAFRQRWRLLPWRYWKVIRNF